MLAAAAGLVACGDVVVHHGDVPDTLSVSQASSGTPFAGLGSAPAAAEIASLQVTPLGGGSPRTIGSLRGPGATVIAFWATYCPPCVAELPGLQRIAPALQRQGVNVVLVDERQDAGKAASWLRAHGVSLAGYADGDGSAHDGLGLLAVPTTAVLAADGSLVARLEGSADNAGLTSLLGHMGFSAQ